MSGEEQQSDAVAHTHTGRGAKYVSISAEKSVELQNAA